MQGDIDSLIKIGAEMLAAARIPESRREAASLLAWAMKKDRAFLIAHPELAPPESQAVLYLEYLTRRSSHEPFHYITGTKEFYGLDFKVSPAVLIPRPETEMLVEQAIEFLSDRPQPFFCEVGVGSGCISIAVLANLATANAVGLEISDEAVAIAGQNSVRHGVSSRFDLRRSDLFWELDAAEEFDLIVSNPPYISIDEFTQLEAGVREFEPTTALTDGDDGLSIIRWIVADAPAFLRPGGLLILEIGYQQADRVMGLLRGGPWENIAARSDFQGIRRTIGATIKAGNIGKTNS